MEHVSSEVSRWTCSEISNSDQPTLKIMESVAGLVADDLNDDSILETETEDK